MSEADTWESIDPKTYADQILITRLKGKLGRSTSLRRRERYAKRIKAAQERIQVRSVHNAIMKSLE